MRRNVPGAVKRLVIGLQRPSGGVYRVEGNFRFIVRP